MAANPRDILIRPIITEKTSQMMRRSKYTFQCSPDANKVEIRQAVEAIFNVKVEKCNYHPRTGKNQTHG
ncbi:MAG: 50S ribosomal protein L23 [Veillonella sp.]